MLNVTFDHPDYPHMAPHILATNEHIAHHCQQVAVLLPGQVHKAKAIDHIQNVGLNMTDTPDVRQAIIKQALKADKQTARLRPEISLRQELLVEIYYMWDKRDHLCNRFQGVIRQLASPWALGQPNR